MKKPSLVSLILSILLIVLGLYQIFFIIAPVNPKVSGMAIALYGFSGIVWHLEKQNMLKNKNK